MPKNRSLLYPIHSLESSTVPHYIVALWTILLAVSLKTLSLPKGTVNNLWTKWNITWLWKWNTSYMLYI